MQLNRNEQGAAARSRWLAELANAIESAQRLAWQLGTASRPSPEARELYSQLEAARIEVEAMRAIHNHTPHPVWLEALGWSGSLLDPAD